jgi:hypothetical protein
VERDGGSPTRSITHVFADAAHFVGLVAAAAHSWSCPKHGYADAYGLGLV